MNTYRVTLQHRLTGQLIGKDIEARSSNNALAKCFKEILEKEKIPKHFLNYISIIKLDTQTRMVF